MSSSPSVPPDSRCVKRGEPLKQPFAAVRRRCTAYVPMRGDQDENRQDLAGLGACRICQPCGGTRGHGGQRTSRTAWWYRADMTTAARNSTRGSAAAEANCTGPASISTEPNSPRGVTGSTRSHRQDQARLPVGMTTLLAPWRRHPLTEAIGPPLCPDGSGLLRQPLNQISMSCVRLPPGCPSRGYFRNQLAKVELPSSRGMARWPCASNARCSSV